MMEIKVEVWKDIPGYEGLYQVSSLGRVKSLYKEMVMNTGGIRKYPEIILAGSKGHNRYHHVLLYNGISRVTKLTHRLVADAFIPNVKDAKQVNHINAIKTDNRVENLEWVSPAENIQHTFKLGRQIHNKGVFDDDNPNNKIVIQLSKDGFFLNSFSSRSEAARAVGITPSWISACVNGKKNSAGGFIWK